MANCCAQPGPAGTVRGSSISTESNLRRRCRRDGLQRTRTIDASHSNGGEGEGGSFFFGWSGGGGGGRGGGGGGESPAGEKNTNKKEYPNRTQLAHKKKNIL